jgi:hypothetical protein
MIKQEIRIRNVQQAKKPLSSDSVLLIAFYFPVNLWLLASLILRLFIIFGVFDLLQSIASGIDASVSIPKSIHNSVANCSYEHKI